MGENVEVWILDIYKPKSISFYRGTGYGKHIQIALDSQAWCSFQLCGDWEKLTALYTLKGLKHFLQVEASSENRVHALTLKGPNVRIEFY